MVSGVTRRIAGYFSGRTIVRLGVALVTAVTGIVPGLVFYFVAAVIMRNLSVAWGAKRLHQVKLT